ncbi:hypothetical protein PsorP6_004189 [Peronosclerospora sorghi]|uniref:Uncharacterized protein n=1 Tax=Peronosclerospora sorghi TaxID=230839 RepID=A0ACC0VMX3_9STRA|nr:hypothetical protein PsorP6_004189 [Peronosclerospora sorghi]
MTEEELRSLLLDLGHAVLKLISGIGSIISAEKISTNEAGTALLPCFLTSSCNYAAEILILLSALIANDSLLDGLPQEFI